MNPIRSAGIAVLKATRLYHPMRDARRDALFGRSSRAAVRGWVAAGRPPPPPDSVKYACIRQYALRYSTPILVETGTFHGNAIFTLRRIFREIHSIELAPALHACAARELGHIGHIHLHLGDSTTELPRVAAGLREPALFWLDGHFCSGPSARGDKDTPVFEELAFLLGRPPGRNVVLIDDARLFNGADGYPTIPQIRELVRSRRPESEFSVDGDIIRIAPV